MGWLWFYLILLIAAVLCWFVVVSNVRADPEHLGPHHLRIVSLGLIFFALVPLIQTARQLK